MNDIALPILTSKNRKYYYKMERKNYVFLHCFFIIISLICFIKNQRYRYIQKKNRILLPKKSNLLPKNQLGIQPFYNLFEKLTVYFGKGHLAGRKKI